MMLIIAHHLVVNSGLIDEFRERPDGSLSMYTMILFGAWGKTGIDCFVFITGYFMCRASISLKKFLKLYLQMVFYGLVLGALFLLNGSIPLTMVSLYKYAHSFLPVYGLEQNFGGCFLVFWLCIPFLNALVHNISKRMHRWLVGLLLFFYTFMPLTPFYGVSLNYVEWFAILFIIASYVRMYEDDFGDISHRMWGILTLASIALASFSIVAYTWRYTSGSTEWFNPYRFVSDSNMVLAMAVAFSSFMWFKGLTLRYSSIINLLGGATFGVLLIHANSDAMRKWLWRDTVDVTGHFHSLAASEMLGYSILAVVTIFFVCAFIDILRQRFVEKALNPRIEEWLLNRWQSIGRKQVSIS